MNKITIEDMKFYAKSKQGKCLSDKYINSKTKLKWRCRLGHEWEAAPEKIKRGRWCPVCGGSMPLTIEEMKSIAKLRGGECLSKRYINSKTKLLWKCKQGYQWEAIPSLIKRGAWCPHCAGTLPLTIEEMRQIAKYKGGKCLSEKYINSETKVSWECKQGHQWEASPDNIKHGKWCPFCAGNIPLTIEEMRKIAESKGGRCLSNKYINANSKLLWECSEGHQWKAIPISIKRGTWCPKCADTFPLTIEEMQKIAASRGGKCLSEKYINKNFKLLWECSEGHRWEAAPDNIKNGRWCPDCSSGLGERICRTFFEQLFKKKFPKTYPEWLLNDHGNRMELDGYCKSLHLAFEHHGKQHYFITKRFSSNQEQLIRRQEHDKQKSQLCKKHDIVLIEVPQIPDLLPIDEVKSYIKVQCLKYVVSLPSNFDEKVINLKNAYINKFARDKMTELTRIAQKKGGKCLSENYIDAFAKLSWECKKKHTWQATAINVIRGTWCPYCWKTSIEELQGIAKSRGGKCLSEKHVHAHSTLSWECKEGHRWEASSSNIKKGTWCPYCAGRRLPSIDQIQDIAKAMEGKCLSTEFINCREKLFWECSEGHQWRARYDSIKAGTWCPVCARKTRINKKIKDSVP